MPDERHENRGPFTPEQKLEIAEVLGNEEAVDKLVEATLWYSGGLETLDKSTKTPALDALAELNDLVTGLASALNVLRDLSLQARMSLTRAYKAATPANVEQFASDVSGYGDAARAAAVQLRDQLREGAPTSRKGRRRKSSRTVFLKRLASIYETATKQTAGLSHHPTTQKVGGPYFRFVRLCTAELSDISELKDEALATAIRAARKGE